MAEVERCPAGHSADLELSGRKALGRHRFPEIRAVADVNDPLRGDSAVVAIALMSAGVLLLLRARHGHTHGARP